MRIFELDKLVRTKLPSIYAADGQVADVVILVGEELREALAQKLHEECQEFEKIKVDDRNARLAELADIAQVISDLEVLTPEAIESDRLERFRAKLTGLLVRLNIDFDDIAPIIDSKKAEKGGFVDRDEQGKWFGVKVLRLTLCDDDPWAEYYSLDPRFTEVIETKTT